MLQMQMASRLFATAALLGSCAAAIAAPVPRSTGYEDFLSFFAGWRAFQRPKLLGGVPDYTATSMLAQHEELAGWQRRLAAFDVTGWPVAHQIDLDIVRAEMNGLEFDHRVLQPWARNPAFYATVFDEQSDQPAREGPQASGSIELWRYRFPLTSQQAADLATALQPVPALLEQARKNLTGDARDLWVYGMGRVQQQGKTLRDWMEPALRARIGRFVPANQREFFTEIDFRDPVLMRTHGYHWIDLAWMEHEPHPSPVRRGALLYNIFDSRTEGFATAMEEMMMHEGLFDARPRSRELIYVLLAQRAARALGDLRLHANQQTLEEAARFAAENTPRGWLRLTGKTVRWEQHLYLQQPAYGTSYVIGKLEVDKLIAARARQLGDKFSLRSVIDDLNTAGLIPIALLRNELTPGAAN